MRVYGSSPLYNYVELVFRSKRLFIASIILATAVTVGVATSRAKTYTARALVLLTGNQNPEPTQDPSRQGVIKFKMNILGLVLKDPEFMKNAFRDGGLEAGKTPQDFDKFAREATKAIVPAYGENVLELSCTWKDRDCEKIVNSFYSAYNLYVLNLETVSTTAQTSLLKELLEEYTAKQQELEKAVIRFRAGSLGETLSDFGSSNARYIQLRDASRVAEDEVQLANTALLEVTRLLESTPKMVEDRRVMEGPTQNPAYQALVTKKTELEEKKRELEGKYTSDNPQLKKTSEDLVKVNADIAKMDGLEGKKETPGRLKTISKVINPAWMRLDAERADREMAVQVAEARLRNYRDQTEKARRDAQTTPNKQYAFKWMTDDLALYTSIRENVRTQVEKAEIAEKQDRELKSRAMRMVVQPEAQPDMVGTQNVLFYVAGPILGLIIAFAFSLLSETLDHSLRTPIEVERHLGKPVLAVLPRMDTPKGAARRQLGGGGPTQPSLPS